jgi:enoyl-CoA hydratase/carnithine racemase
MSYQTLAIEPRDQVLLVTLNRPKALNALNTQMGRELCELWTRLAAEPGATRCVVLTGAGERAFCAGADLKERDGMAQADWQAQHELFERGFMALMEFPLPVIAALNGHAFGGGREIALCCDFIYASNVARFALPEVRLGIMPGGGGTQSLARAAGERRAKELILSGRQFNAQEGEAWAIFNKASDNPLADALLKRVARAEPERINAREWIILLYSAVFILVTWFLAVLLAIYNRNASPTGLKTRRAQELRGSVEWDRGLAESEARARAAQWIAELRSRFWKRMAD